jgi:hypothetical protein
MTPKQHEKIIKAAYRRGLTLGLIIAAMAFIITSYILVVALA